MSLLGARLQLQPQEISPPPTANLDRSNDKVYENVTGLVKAVIEMSNRIQPAAPEEYVPMVKVGSLCIFSHILKTRGLFISCCFKVTSRRHHHHLVMGIMVSFQSGLLLLSFLFLGGGSCAEDSTSDSGRDASCAASQHTQRGQQKDDLPWRPSLLSPSTFFIITCAISD